MSEATHCRLENSCNICTCSACALVGVRVARSIAARTIEEHTHTHTHTCKAPDTQGLHAMCQKPALLRVGGDSHVLKGSHDPNSRHWTSVALLAPPCARRCSTPADLGRRSEGFLYTKRKDGTILGKGDDKTKAGKWRHLLSTGQRPHFSDHEAHQSI